jgi:hypothetical protein
MSSTAVPNTAMSSYAMSIPGMSVIFMTRITIFLMPYFSTLTTDQAAICAEIDAMLSSYLPRDRADYIAAAKAIAYSFASLDMLAEVRRAGTSMPDNQRIRQRACANSFGRAADRAEKQLAERLNCDAPKAKRAKAPAADPTDQEAADALDVAASHIDTTRNRLANPPTTFGGNRRAGGLFNDLMAQHAAAPNHADAPPHQGATAQQAQPSTGQQQPAAGQHQPATGQHQPAAARTPQAA